MVSRRIALLVLASLQATALDSRLTSTSPRCAVKVSSANASAGPCGFDVATRTFAGTSAQQAACLLKHVGRGAALGSSDLADQLAAMVGTASQPKLDQLGRYLASRGIDPASELGGALRPGLAARYFVIHDTSSPNCSNKKAACPTWGEFPPGMNTSAWSGNQSFGGYAAHPRTLKAHIITDRIGRSLSARDLAEHVSHTRFDFCYDADAKVGLFVGVENIQPRIGKPARPAGRFNDLIAPDPGFTDAQYERLALIYIVASARHGAWLIPAYHAVLDPYYDPASAHDDPQNFDMASFMNKLTALVAAIRQA